VILHDGPVRVPEDARPGPATMRISLAEDSTYASIPTSIPVEIR